MVSGTMPSSPKVKKTYENVRNLQTENQVNLIILLVESITMKTVSVK